MTVYRPAPDDPRGTLDAFTEWTDVGPSRDSLDCAEARLTPVPAVVFPIISARYSEKGAPTALHLGHPKTEDRSVYPLRRGQVVVFRLEVKFAGGYHAAIATVGEHMIELEKVAYDDDAKKRVLDHFGCVLGENEVMRFPLLVPSSVPVS